MMIIKSSKSCDEKYKPLRHLSFPDHNRAPAFVTVAYYSTEEIATSRKKFGVKSEQTLKLLVQAVYPL